MIPKKHAYTCPLLMEITRLWHRWVFWEDARWVPSDGSNIVAVWLGTHGYELRCLFPTWAILAELRLRNAWRRLWFRLRERC